MASSYWINAYYEILDDPKMGRLLSDHIWRRAIEFFLLAGEGGCLPSVRDIAWRLHTTEDDVIDCMKKLNSDGLVRDTDCGWIVSLPVHVPAKTNRPSAEVWMRIREFIFERDNYTCQYCGARGVRLECDHVIPVSRGGSSEYDNLVTACFRCNRSKGDKTLDDWMGWKDA